jgi:hypothetical protein
LFNTTEQWSDNAAKITRLWPEQSGFPEEVKVLSDTQVTSYTLNKAENSLGQELDSQTIKAFDQR